jgi:hypothetical protein
MGAWAASTAYALDDVVTTSGKTYICILGYTSGSSFAVGSNWSIMAEKGTDGTTVGTGTAGQVLKTNSAGTGTEWGAAGGGLKVGTDFFLSNGGNGEWSTRQMITSTSWTYVSNSEIDCSALGTVGTKRFLISYNVAVGLRNWTHGALMAQYSQDNGSTWNDFSNQMTASYHYEHTNAENHRHDKSGFTLTGNFTGVIRFRLLAKISSGSNGLGINTYDQDSGTTYSSSNGYVIALN